MASLRIQRTEVLSVDEMLDRARASAYLRECGLGHISKFPLFYHNVYLVEPDLLQGALRLWTIYIALEALLMQISMQAYLTTGLDLGGGWQRQTYAFLWTMVLILDVMSLAITTMFLYYLYVVPQVLTFKFGHIGGWVQLPSALAILVTLLSLGTIAFTTWMLYGHIFGIYCVIVEVVGVAFALFGACRLAKGYRR